MKLKNLARRLRRWLRSVPYAEWIRRYDSLDGDRRARISSRIAAMGKAPLISIVMPVCDPPLAFLEQALKSVRKQVYPHWELCIADDASEDPGVATLLKRHASEDARIKLSFRMRRGHISRASNSALETATGDFVVLMDHDDLLSEDALFWVAETGLKHPQAALIYSDEDRISEEGRRHLPYFKPDWNYRLFLSQNFFNHLGAYRRSLLTELGGFREGYEGSQDYDLVLRCIEKIDATQIVHIPRVLYHWRVHSRSTAQSIEAKPYALVAGERVLNEHLARRGLDGKISVDPSSGFYRWKQPLPELAPKVSILIGAREGDAAGQRCAEALRSKTAYPDFEILFDEEAARGTYLCFVDPGLSPENEGWLAEMMGMALDSQTGAVGAKIFDKEDRILEAGMILGMKGLLGHAFQGLAAGQGGYFQRALVAQEYSALSGACLLVSKAHCAAAGGWSGSGELEAADFCLRLAAQGLKNLWTPFALMRRLDQGTPEPSPDDPAAFRVKWQGLLEADPAYNPNLSLAKEDFSLAWPPRVESF
jgi:glycosyltransferase involved in cell wall biosynthesis